MRRIISMRVILGAAGALLAAITVLISGSVSVRSSESALLAAAQAQAQLEARNLALLSDEALLSEYPELTLMPVTANLVQARHDIVLAVVTDHHGRVLGHPDARRLGTAYVLPDGLVPVVAPNLARGERLWDGASLFVAEAPVQRGAQEMGRAVIGLSKAPLRADLAAAQRRMLQLAAVLVAAVSLLSAAMMSYLMRPVGALRAGLTRLGAGDLDTPMRVHDITEFGLLADTVNDLAAQLKAARGTALDREREIAETQREVILTLGQVVESRSSETANHVRRVGEMSRRLALLAGLSVAEAERMWLASPMHDIGKIGIPDAILNKPGRLTPAEFEVMKDHTVIGHRILAGSRRPVLQAAAVIALQHHEHWDGSGYPHGLAGEAIDIRGRIVALTDVFDAVFSKRVYRDAMPLDEALGVILDGRGRQFDPQLVDLFFAHFADFMSDHREFGGERESERDTARARTPDSDAVAAVTAELVSIS
ncbi:MAG: HD domain-containing protein [Candidatus Krumholzibacteriia bacterium]